MTDLIAAVIAELETNLGYLRRVAAVNSVLNPPLENGFPCAGVKDGEENFESLPGQRDRETLSLEIAVYQDLPGEDSGAAVVGSAPERGDSFKGVAEIAREVRARLNDNFFRAVFGEKIYHAHVDKIAASETLGDDAQPLMQMKILSVTYRRFS